MNCLVLISLVFLLFYRVECNSLLEASTNKIKYRTAGAVAFSDELNLIIYSFGLDSTAAVLSSTPLLTYRPATGYKFLPYTESSNAPSLRFGAVSTFFNNSTLIVGLGGVEGVPDGADMWNLNLKLLEWTRVDPLYCRNLVSGSSLCPSQRFFSANALITSGSKANQWLIHGGCDSSFLSYRSDSWLWNPSLNNWTSIPYANSGPNGRAFHSMVFYGSSVYLIGGHDSSSTFSNAWILNVDTFLWTPLTLIGSSLPSLRYTSSVIFASLMYVLIGATPSPPSACSPNFANLYSLNLATGSLVFVTKFTGVCNNIYPSIALLNGKIYASNFFDTDTKLQQSASYDILLNIVSANSFFSSSRDFTSYTRVFMGSTFLNNKFILYGGLGGQSSNEGESLNLLTGTWTNTSFVGYSPSLYAYAYVTFNNSMFVHGGYVAGSSTPSNLFYKMTSDLTSADRFEWSTLATSGSSLKNMAYHSGVILQSPSNSANIYYYLVMYSGLSILPGASDDLFAICLNDNSFLVTSLTMDSAKSVYKYAAISIGQRVIVYGGLSNVAQNNIITYDASFNASGKIVDNPMVGLASSPFKIQTATGNGPSGRYSMAFTSYSSRYMVIFGGTNHNSKYYNDLWMLDCLGTGEIPSFSWIELQYSNSLSETYGAVMIIVGSRIIISGGAGPTISSDLTYVIGPYSSVVVNSVTGNNALCTVDPGVNSCVSMSKALTIFAGGSTQSVLFDSGITVRESNITIGTAVSLGSSSGVVVWDCESSQCLIISTGRSETTLISNIAFINGKNSILTLSSGSLVLTSCTFKDSVSTQGAALNLKGSGVVNIVQCSFSSLVSSYLGGAIYASEVTLTISKSNFISNMVSGSLGQSAGGSICAITCPVFVSSCTFRNNSAQASGSIVSYGGAIYTYSSGLISVENIFSYNSASNGGSVSLRGTTDITAVGFVPSGSSFIRSDNDSFSFNNAYLSGGAIWIQSGDVSTVSSSNFSRNSAVDGAAVTSVSSSGFNFIKSVFYANSASGNGGAINMVSSSTSLSYVTFLSNVAFGGGGAIFWSTFNDLPSEFFSPAIISPTFLNNNASYGINLATPVATLSYINVSAVNLMQTSGAIISPSIVVAMLDYYGSIIVTDSSSTVSALPVVLVSGSTVQTMSQGISKYSLLQTNIPSNSSDSIRFSVTTSYLTGKNVESVPIKLSMRACVPGEYVVNFLCSKCSAGKFSNVTMSTFCANCVLGTFSETEGLTICSGCSRGSYSLLEGSSACLSCNQGTYSPNIGSSTCLQCPAGNYSVRIASTRCTPCDAGSYNGSPSQSSCSFCSAGTYSLAIGKTTCLSCSKGMYSNTLGSTSCVECIAGQYAQNDGLTICYVCPSGMFQNVSSGTSCISCSKGYIAASTGGTVCSACLAGSYSNSIGQSTCSLCSSGEYQSLIGSTYCNKCPSSSVATVDSSGCICPKGYYTTSSNGVINCIECPVGASCDVTGLMRSNLAAAPGYYPYISENLEAPTFVSCYNSEACVGARLISNNSVNLNVCADNYHGPLCAVCNTGYSLSNSFVCSECPTQSLNSFKIFGIALGFFIFGAIYTHLNISEKDKENVVSHLSKIIVAMIQFNGLASQFPFDWPYPTNLLLSWQSQTGYIGGSLFSSQCSLSESSISYFYVTSVLFLLLPIVIILFFSTFYYAKNFFFPNMISSLLEQVIAASIVLLLLIYPSLTKQALDLFQCITLGDSSTDVYLLSDLSQQCWTSDHLKWCFGVGIPMIVLYVIGIPLFSYIRLQAFADRLNSKEAIPYSHLFRSFTPKFFYWEFVVITREVLLVIIEVFLSQVALVVQVLNALLLCVLAISAHVYARPFRADSPNRLEFASLYTTFFTFFFGILLSLESSGDSLKQFYSIAIFVCNVAFFVYAFYLVIVEAYLHYASPKIAASTIEVSNELTKLKIDSSTPSVTPLVKFDFTNESKPEELETGNLIQ